MRIEPHPNPGTLADFDPRCVSSLNGIIETTDVQIVVSSDWKYWVDFDEMCRFYMNQGISRTPYGMTPKSGVFDFGRVAFDRSSEIREWLELNPNVEKWAWVDDIDMRGLLKNGFWIQDPHESVGISSFRYGIADFFS